jgi:hypothetical protein
MPLTPIGARCRRCGRSFYLFEVRDEGTGTCPRCGRPLAADWTAVLLEDIARAEIAQRHLFQALRRLRKLPGNLAVRPHTLLRNFFKEIGWQNDLADDPEMLREELRHIRQHVSAWQRLDQKDTGNRPRRSWRQRLIETIAGRRPELDTAPTGNTGILDEDSFLPESAADSREIATTNA